MGHRWPLQWTGVNAVFQVARTAAASDARQLALVNGCRMASRGWQLVFPWDLLTTWTGRDGTVDKESGGG